MPRIAHKRWMNPDAKAVGERIRKLRQQCGWRQADLANESGVERTAIANYEQGVCFPPVPALRKLALALRVSIDDLAFDQRRPETVLHDRKLLELFQRVDQLNFRIKDLVQEVVEGLLTKQDERERRHSLAR